MHINQGRQRQTVSGLNYKYGKQVHNLCFKLPWIRLESEGQVPNRHSELLFGDVVRGRDTPAIGRPCKKG